MQPTIEKASVEADQQIYICYEWWVRFEAIETRRKRPRKTIIGHQLLASNSDELLGSLERVCRSKKWTLVKMISYTALRIGFAFWQDKPGKPFVTKEEQAIIPLPNGGKQVIVDPQGG